MTTRLSLDAAVSVRALNARDARFDGVFFVGITTTRIYCRPRGVEARRDVRTQRENDLVRLTLAYCAPLDWNALMTMLGASALPGVEDVQGRRYGRTVRLDGRSGVVFAEDSGDGEVKIDLLMTIDGIDDQLATTIVMRALQWPDAFPASDAGAEKWRPWRAYAALHLWMSDCCDGGTGDGESI